MTCKYKLSTQSSTSSFQTDRDSPVNGQQYALQFIPFMSSHCFKSKVNLPGLQLMLKLFYSGPSSRKGKSVHNRALFQANANHGNFNVISFLLLTIVYLCLITRHVNCQPRLPTATSNAQPNYHLRPSPSLTLNPNHRYQNYSLPAQNQQQPPKQQPQPQQSQQLNANYYQYHQSIPCRDLPDPYGFQSLPCYCTLEPNNSTHINCDSVPFFGPFQVASSLSFPTYTGRRVSSYTQRHAGIQSLQSQLFTASGIKLRKLDFSHNLLRRFHERFLDGIEPFLIEINFSHNLLGDTLNPIFSTNEFYLLSSLQVLDLSYNQLRALDSNIFKGLKNLTQLNLNGNQFKDVPYPSLSQLRTLKVLGLASNRLTELTADDLPKSLSNSLRTLNLTDNRLTNLLPGSLSHLTQLTELYLGHNQLTHLRPNAMEGLNFLEILDLSSNLLDNVPIETLNGLRKLRKLYLGSNLIEILEKDGLGLGDLPSLEYLDLSRNNLVSLGDHHVFTGLPRLRTLDLSYNSLRKLDLSEEQLFAPLTKLETLDLTDNSLESFPVHLMYPLTSLRKLFLDYNRITELTEESVLSIGSSLDELSMAYNRLTYLPSYLASKSKNLRLLNLHGNGIASVSQDLFDPIAEAILGLDLGLNQLTQLPRLTFPRLMILNLASNELSTLEPDTLIDLPSLRHCNLSHNLFSSLSPSLFTRNTHLEVIDLSANLIEKLDEGTFTNGSSFTIINLSKNRIKEISLGAFQGLYRLHKLDLSYNELSTLKPGTFNETPSLKTLKLSFNRLTSLKGEYFTPRTRIETLDLSDNSISYLYPNSFTGHRRLKTLDLSRNKLSYFPAEILAGLRHLTSINLSSNKIASLDSSDFANMPFLRSLDLSFNGLTYIGPNSFSNSTLLYTLDLSGNAIASLDRATFKGLTRLRLDLSDNRLNYLPSEMFSRSYLSRLETINLSHNNFTIFPLESLSHQYLNLQSIDLSYNSLTTLPSNVNLMVNIKSLDVSNNPLTPEAVTSLLSEPKSIRNLNVAFTGLNSLPSIMETPFLQSLNISGNNITHLKSSTLQKTTLLETFDLSRNELTSLGNLINGLKTSTSDLRALYLNGNPLSSIRKDDFKEFKSLEILDISNLTALSNLDCSSLVSLVNLRTLYMYGYPSLESLSIQECLAHLSTKLDRLGVEVKEDHLQGHLQKAFSPRLNEILITGSKLTSLSPSCLNGLKSSTLSLTLTDTSVSLIPSNLFSPLPMSTRIDFTLSSNEISSLNGKFLDSLDIKPVNMKIYGLPANPIVCDCSLEPLYKWLAEKMSRLNWFQNELPIDSIDKLTCSGPESLRGYRLIELTPEDLTCGDILSESSVDSSSISSSSSSSSSSITSTTEIISEPVTLATPVTPRKQPNSNKKPEIIFQSTRKPNHHSSSSSVNLRGMIKPRTHDPTHRRTALTKVDTMIIGIAAGVIAFVCILILIICVIRARSPSTMPLDTAYNTAYHGLAGAGGLSAAATLRAPNACTCLKSMTCGSCYVPGITNSNSNGTLRPSLTYYGNETLRPVPIKMLSSTGTLGRGGKAPSYYISYPDMDTDGHK
ncbi:chaoptin-like [Tetranychus urticae]|uniref:chaoptin-like n=1 Tax=Tetranychus urticae TaxID=32264 RepID=UPI00077BD835|nr:chaoptin-like [Tetranychus urticae]